MEGDSLGTEEPAGEAGNSLFAGKLPIKVALNELRLRLLDLTGRNRLINFKHTAGKSLQFVHTSIDGAFRRLIADQSSKVTIAPLTEPDRADWVRRNGRLMRPEAKDHAVNIGIDPSHELMRARGRTLSASMSGSQARTLFFAEDLGKHCRKLEREAKLAIEETGANMLYLVMGFLEFPEAPDSDKRYRAPMLCVPVSIGKTEEGRHTTFHLNYTGEELSDNLSLREKVKRDFGLNLPEYDIESEPSVEAYFDEITQAISTLPNWRVSRMMTLTLLSFTNMLLVRDLDPENWPQLNRTSELLGHPVVKQVFEGRPSSGESQYAGEFAIDDHPKADIPLIYDADSSQHSALIDVLEGRNRVIEGPPGTGKSQTITNLIAAALQAGKTILFVAEKLAALEVVKSRLTQAGLAPFVLELHSNKTNKKRVLADIEQRINMRIPSHAELPELLERLQEKRKELKAYSDLMKSKAGNSLDLTLHQVMWRAERHRMRSGDCASAVQHLDFLPAPRTTASQFSAICDRLRYLAEQLEPIGAFDSTHVLWGFFPDEFKPEDDLPVQRTLQDFALKFEAFAAATAGAAALLGGENINMSVISSQSLLNVLANLAPANSGDVDFTCLPAFFTAADPLALKSNAILLDLQARQRRVAKEEGELRRLLVSIEPASEEVCTEAKRAIQALKVLGLGMCSQGSLGTRQDSLQKPIEAAWEALSNLKVIADLAGLPFVGLKSEIARLGALAACLSAAPIQSAHLRHDGLRSSGSVKVITAAKAKLTQIQAQSARFEAALYMDLLPSDGELKESILTLREGDAWYRIFQGRWRKALRMHRQMDRSKSKKRGSERLADLESLLKHRESERAWHAEPAFVTVAGPHFAGEKTPFDGLAACAKWAEEGSMTLEAVGVTLDAFDPLKIERSKLALLARQVPVMEAAFNALGELDEAIQGLLPSAASRARKEFESPDHRVRVQAAEGVVESIAKAVALMECRVLPGAFAEAGLDALVVSRDVQIQIAELENHAAGQILLGSRFIGRATNLEPAFAAFTFGSLIKKAGLPLRIESLLLTEEFEANHERLNAYLSAINLGWQWALEFERRMSKYGKFNPAQWADPLGKSTTEYAQTLAARTRSATENLGGLMPWAQYVGAREEVTRLGLEGYVTLLENRVVPPDKLKDAFIYRFYASLAQTAFEKSTTLRRFSGRRHTSVREEFAELDKEIIKLRGRQVAHECRKQNVPPDGNHGVRVDEKTEMKLLEHLMPQQRPRVPVRKMLKRAGGAIQALKPCFMMGPQAVAQFLEPGGLHFDIVVMDEASQLRPEEAIGAIARGTQLVVVGDPKQLPPTSFFSRMSLTDGGDEDLGQLATTDAESILDVCISHFQPVRTLRWHYRSQHESLIAFSNHHFYRGNLVVFPSPYPKGKTLGLRYHYVGDSVYENQMNQVEARRVVDAIVDHMLHRSHDSLGIVTLNIKQRDLVHEMWEERRRDFPEAANFAKRWDEVGLGLFIKNLENVQGDERDCIVISTTFGKPKGTAVVRQNFGPISRSGGWRRLNVLFTRARKSVAVFSSMRPEDIVVDTKTPEGTRALRNYLEYARGGVLPTERETNLPSDSDFEISVIDVLRTKGYEVTPQLGVSGFRIDIAVKHPEHRSGYLAAIECDGATYHSGLSVRDRDRIRQEILEGLGWKNRIWRIWSTDWFRNPLAETERLMQFLDGLRRMPVPDEYLVVDIEEEPTPEPLADDGTVEDAAESLVFEDEDEDLEVEVGDLVTYGRADAPDQETLVRITNHLTNPEMGLVAENTPLGTVLMGATVGESVVLRVPGRAPQSFVIQSIKRATHDATS